MEEATTDLIVDQIEKKDVNKRRGGKRPNSGGGSGGYRPGGGRPKGSRNVKNILKDEALKELQDKYVLKQRVLDAIPISLRRNETALKEALKEINEEEIEQTFKKRIHLHSNRLLTALLTAAMGEQFLYKVVVASDDQGKFKKKHVQVTDPEEIREYLDNPMDVEGSDYYYISKKTPDITAINSLLDRMMGRPTTKVVGPNNSDGSEGPIKIISVNYSQTPQIQPPQEPVKMVAEVIKDVIEEQNGDTATS